MAVNDDIMNRHMLHIVSLERQLGTINGTITSMLNAHANIIKNIVTDNSSITTTISLVRSNTTKDYAAIEDLVMNNIIRMGINEASFQKNNLQRSLGGLYTVKATGPRTIRSFLDTAPLAPNRSNITTPLSFRQWISRIGRTEMKSVESIIRSGYVEGLSKSTIASRLTAIGGGLLRGKASVMSLVRTTHTHAQNAVADMLYADNSDVLNGYEWLSTLDTRTSGICRGRDGKVYKTDSNIFPPAHFNCRSTTVPIVKSLEDLPVPRTRKERLSGKRRASFTGQVPAALDYDSWLRTQNPSIQDEILGMSQANVFRQGKLHISKFTNIYGRPISMNRLLDLDSNVIKSSTYGAQYQRGQDVTQFDIVQPIVNVNNLIDNMAALTTFIGANAYIANINRGQLNFTSVNFTQDYRDYLKRNDGTIFRGSRRLGTDVAAWNAELALLDESAISSKQYRFIIDMLGALRTTLRGNQRVVVIRMLRKLFENNNYNPTIENINRYLLSRLNYEARAITRSYFRNQ